MTGDISINDGNFKKQNYMLVIWGEEEEKDKDIPLAYNMLLK